MRSKIRNPAPKSNEESVSAPIRDWTAIVIVTAHFFYYDLRYLGNSVPEKTLVFERYTESARRVIFFARYFAGRTGSLEIETQHLLLGLLRQAKALGAAFSVHHGQRKKFGEESGKANQSERKFQVQWISRLVVQANAL
jgi:hypothetical protein